MLILGIETSCDETAAAVVKDGTQILANVVASSEKLHSKTGGIIPEVAAREQLKYLLPVIEKAIRKSSLVSPISSRHLDAIAVTIGPGLIGSLIVGVQTSRALAWLWQKPLVPVNHLHAHLYANFLNQQFNHITIQQSLLPAVGLIASGGHTDLVLIKNHDDIQWLGTTRDDAAGECFDKCSRLLRLGYPGGPAIEASASKLKVKNLPRVPTQCRDLRGQKLKIKLPRPMLNQDNFDFSFSGLKTALLNHVNKLKSMKQLNNETIEQLAFAIQEAITDCLVAKALKAAKELHVKSILLGGGVAANSRLRQKFKLEIGNWKLEIGLHIPPPPLCTDNAASIAACAYFNYHPLDWRKIKPNPNLRLS